MIDVFNIDNMELLSRYPNKHFDLAIVDPPYGLGDRLVNGAGKYVMKKYKKSYNEKKWDVVPSKEFFTELFRVSKNQIIWGGNYFDLPPTRGILCWDKKQFMPTFSRWEYAWTSFDKPAKMLEAKSQETMRFHPTQKPVYLYKFCLENYAKPGDKILDTHLGAAGIAIACLDYEYDLTACEIDPEYYAKAMKRINEHAAQPKMFDTEEKIIQSNLFNE